MIVTCKLRKTEATQQSVFHFLLNKIDFSFDESINLLYISHITEV